MSWLIGHGFDFAGSSPAINCHQVALGFVAARISSM